MKRILIYSHDTYGLGNIRRTLTIAEHLVDAHEDVSVLIVSGSPMLHAFRVRPRIDYIKLPCLTRGEDGHYGVKTLGISYEAAIRMRSRMLGAAMLDFEPDLVVVDKKPFGVDDELHSALRLARSLPTPPRLVLLLRDILDTPESTTRIWRRNGYFEAIEAHYDSVLVLGSTDVFDLAAEYGFPEACEAKVEQCGYLRRPPGRASRIEMRKELGVAKTHTLILVTPGGGQDGACLAHAFLDGLGLGGLRGASTALVTGPEMATEHQHQLAQKAALLPDVEIIEFTDDMMSYVGASDVVVSMGGYNTVCEFLSADKRAVVVPRVRPVEEQRIRAEKLAGAGRITMVHPDDLTPRSLMAAVATELSCARRDDEACSPDLGGLEMVEKHLAAMLNDG